MRKPFRILFSILFLAMMLTACASEKSSLDSAQPEIASITSGRKGVVITVNPVDGVNSYRILRKNEDQKWAVYAHSKSASYTDEGVESGGTYSYTVLCESDDGTKMRSGYDKTGKTITYISPPELSGISNVFGGVKVEWKAPKGAVKYRVFRKNLEEGDDAEWKPVASTSALNITDTSVISGKEYAYTVRCLDNSDGYCSSFDAAGLTAQYFEAPVLRGIIRINGNVRITWSPVEGADQYRVYRKDEASSWQALIDTTSTKFIDETAQEGKTYTYVVRCLDIYGRLISSFDPQGVSIMM